MNQFPNHETESDAEELVDIRDVSVDKTLPREERIASFVRQIIRNRTVCFPEFLSKTDLS